MLWVKRNPTIEDLYEDAEKVENITKTSNDALVAYSGDNTGRSPRDKRVVLDNNTDGIWWGDINIPISRPLFKFYTDFAKKYLNNKNRYEIDAYAGWDLENRIRIRTICTSPYHALFIRNMLIPTDEVFENPDFTFYNVSELKLSNATEKIRDIEKDRELREKLVGIDFTNMEMVIYGTMYAGEMKKGILTLMMYLMQKKGHLTLHSAAGKTNIGTCMFFGLSGTGKTTLSAQTKLIGDDEHVWTGNGIFNIEGGCYAKCIGLKKTQEPEIYNAIKYGAVLENIVMDGDLTPDFSDCSITMNTRCAYPLRHLTNIVTPSLGDHPKNIIFLTCDGTGLLPPVAKLNKEDAIRYFLLGYTSKMPGTEMGIDKPTTIFSPCFGEPFLVWQPMKYAKLLEQKIEEHSPNVWLLNTGWYKGGYGKGQRMPLKITRRIVDLIMSEEILTREFEIFPNLNLEVPKKLDDDIDENVLFPNKNWENEDEYWNKLDELIELFDEKYEKIINL